MNLKTSINTLRTETIFYQLFQTFPTLLMELLGEDPASIASYQFTSVEVKEKAFRFDGVFLPQSEDKTIWFVEVQFQKVHESALTMLVSSPKNLLSREV